MKRFFVSWEIELDAEDPHDAARQALEVQRDPASIAQVFTCTAEGMGPVQVDLWTDDAQEGVLTFDVWGEDATFPREDWQFEVAEGDTNHGYWAWVRQQRELASDGEEDGYQGPGVGSNI